MSAANMTKESDIAFREMVFGIAQVRANVLRRNVTLYILSQGFAVEENNASRDDYKEKVEFQPQSLRKGK